MKKKTILLVSLLTLGTLASCSNNEQPQIVEKYNLEIVTPSKTTLEVGEELILKASYTKVEVKKQASSQSYVWKSSDSSVASIDENGKVVALKQGTTSITVEYNGLVSEALVLTIKEKVLPIKVSINTPSKSTIEQEESLKLEATVENNKDNLPVVWNSSLESVATIDQTGLVLGVGIGETTITAKVGDVVSEGIKLIVKEKTILVETIQLSVPKLAIGVGEMVEVSATLLPENATDKTYTLESSNPLKVRVDGNKIEGLAKTAVDEKVTITATTKNGKTSSVDVTVVDLAESVLPEIQNKLNASIALEEENLKSGSLLMKKYDGTNTEIESLNQTFEVFNDNKVEVKTVQTNSKYSYSNKNEVLTYGKFNNKFYSIVQRIDELGNKTYYSQNNKDVVAGPNATYKEMLEKDALLLSKMVDLDNNRNAAKCGVSFKVLNQLVNNSNAFSSSDSKQKLVYKKVDALTHNLSSNFESSSGIEEVTLTLKFLENGLLESAIFENKEFEQDLDTLAKGALKERTTYEVNLVASTRRASNGIALDFDKLAISSYTPYLSSDYSGNKELVEFKVGQKAYVHAKDLLPTEAYKDMDEISIKSVSDPTAVKLGYGNDSLTFLKACKNLTITFVSTYKNVEKSLVIEVKEEAVTEIKLPTSLVTKDFINYKREITISGTPKNAKPNIEVQLENNTANAVATIKAGTTNVIEVTGKNSGSVTLVIIEKTLGVSKALRHTITYLEDTDINIAQYIGEGQVKVVNDSGYYFNLINFTHTSNTNKGTYSASIDGETITGTYEVNNKVVSISQGVGTSYNILSMRSYRSNDYSIFNIEYDDGFDPYTARISIL